jgi:hypothetical protein
MSVEVGILANHMNRPSLRKKTKSVHVKANSCLDILVQAESLYMVEISDRKGEEGSKGWLLLLF